MTARPPTNAELKADMEELSAKVDALSASINGLVKAWDNATFLVAVIKWLGGAAVAVSGFVYVITHFGQSK